MTPETAPEVGIFERAMQTLELPPRPQQVELVGHIRNGGQVVEKDDCEVVLPVFVQAGTGTGKSYVVLAEALESARSTGLPSVVVCPNNTLIDQYVHKDAPRIQGAVGGDFYYLKGRSHYLCSDSHGVRMRGLRDPDWDGVDWVQELLKSGDLEWKQHGLGQEFGCPGSEECDADACGIDAARFRASQADVVITNAHVLTWDWQLRSWTDGEKALLPDKGALFVDECHELEGVVRGVLSTEIPHGSRLYVGGRFGRTQFDAIEGFAEWRDATSDRMWREGESETHRPDLESDLELAEIFGHVRAEMSAIRVELGDLREMGEGGPEDAGRAADLKKRLRALDAFRAWGTEDLQFVSVVERRGEDADGKLSLRRICVAAPGFSFGLLTAQPSFLMSGTVPSSDRRRLGVGKAKLRILDAPFDYTRCTMYISPKDATIREDERARIATATKAIEAARRDGGGTLILFTSWRDLEAVTVQVHAKLGYPEDFWVQAREYEPGESLADDVKAFAASGNGVLCGVRSLFTGLDVPGKALSQVIVWKLPYSVPTIEVQAIQAEFGRSVYKDQMLMVLAQAIGRLVRTTEDTGRILIMDQRAAQLDFETNHMTAHLAEFRRI